MNNRAGAVKQEHVGIMWKTVSGACNLACDYCYSSIRRGLSGCKETRISSTLLEQCIQKYMERTNGFASFAWQGGEPLLAGLGFFEEAVALQAKYAPPHTIISNAIQTNGTLITDQWANFFNKYRFLVGVSLDGPQQIHDARRVDAFGKGTFDRVMRGLEVLHTHRVEFNILTVVHHGNVHRAAEMLHFFEAEGFHYLQFIPCMNFEAQNIQQPGLYDITPEQYGDFLCEAFDYWYNDGEPRLSIRFFDELLSMYIHREPALCIHQEACPRTMILEANGDAYPCDFYLHSTWKVGNIGVQSMEEILFNPTYERFLALKTTKPAACLTCEWEHLCHGGCPRNRQWTPDMNSCTADYFCASYQQLYRYVDQRMKVLGEKTRVRLFAQNVRYLTKEELPKRNDRCPCGSGKKYKQCCAELNLI